MEKKIIDRIVAGSGSPGAHDLWLDTSSENYELKVNVDGTSDGWKTIGGGSGSGGGDDGGSDEPTEVYIKFKAENFGIRDNDFVPDTVDRSKGYALDEIFDMSGGVLEALIKAQEDARDNLISSGYALEDVASLVGYNYYSNGNANSYLDNKSFNYASYESGEFSSMDGSYPVISTVFMKYDGQWTAKTFIQIAGTNLKGYSWTAPNIIFEKNDEDGKWYIVYAH